MAKKLIDILSEKAKGNRFFTKEETDSYLRDLIPSKDKSYIAEAEKGDFSHFEKMSTTSRVALASRFYTEHRGYFSGTPDEAFGKIYAADIKSPMNEYQNPLLRLAISLGMREEGRGEFFRTLDGMLNERVMRDTLKPVSEEAKKDLTTEFGKEVAGEMLERDGKNKKVIAKTMLMAQLGGLVEAGPDGEKNWEGNIANAFAHCSRVCVAMPGGEKGQEELYSAFLGAEPGKGVMKSRGGATHSVERSKIADGLRMREKKHKITHMADQYGMNVAVGGLGRKGITGPGGKRLLLNDGSCGHMYMHIEKGDAEHYGGLLIGFESDEYDHTNQCGHKHDLLATGEHASSFGGQRNDEIGNKYDGRRIDLRNLSPEELTEVFQAFDKKYDAMTPREREDFTDKLCHDRMSQKEMSDLLEGLGMKKEKAASIAAKGLNPTLTEQNKKDMKVLFDSAKNCMQASGMEFTEYKKEEIPKDLRRQLEELPKELKPYADKLIEAHERVSEVAREQTEIASRFGFVKEGAQLLTGDPSSALVIGKAALQKEAEAKRRAQLAMINERKITDTIQYFLMHKEMEEITGKIDGFVQKFADEKPLGVGQVFDSIDVIPDKSQVEKLTEKMQSSKRSFLGVGTKNSEEYEDVVDCMRWVEETSKLPDTKENSEEKILAYKALSEACKDYEDKHAKPRTKEGRERLAIVQEASKLTDDYFEDKTGLKRNPDLVVSEFRKKIAGDRPLDKKSIRMTVKELMKEEQEQNGKKGKGVGKKSMHERYAEMKQPKEKEQEELSVKRG